jgi:hypothetical protein
MKNNIIYLVLCILLLISFVSCSSNNPTDDNRNVPVYNTPMPVVTPTPPLNIQPSTDTNPQSTPTGGAEDTDIFEFLSGFTGVDTDVASPRQHNSPFSLFSYLYQVPFVCYDYDTETLYYVNHGISFWPVTNDSFLYSYKNRVRQVVIEMPVNYPVYFDGVIYFTSHEDLYLLYGWDYYPAGYIYKYTIHTQTVERFGSILAYGLIVYDDYLYFYESPMMNGEDVTGGRRRLRIPLSGGEPEDIGDFLPFYYGEYQLKLLTNEEGYHSLVLYSSENTVTVIDFHAFSIFRAGMNFCLYGDILFFKYERGFISVNLRNGEVVHYYQEGGKISAIIMIGDTLYATLVRSEVDIILCMYNNQKNQFEEIDVEDFDDSFNPRSLVTDGILMYTTAMSGRMFPSNKISIIQINQTWNRQYRGRVINY